MQKLEFSVNVNAAPAKVWDILWGMGTYPLWTAPFSPDGAEGRVETDGWKKGTKVLFLGASGEGMVSEVADNVENSYMSFRHNGMVKDGVEDTSSPQVKEWSGSMENYTLTATNGGTLLKIDIDVADAYIDYFEKAWPLALAKVKELAEQR